ncbi:hypothetical protein Pcinc_037966 [Petrolisthes cinctipes]|uniref:Fringe-like glycosyltransferase domain-containing protein n=1 Tax=Petrolisthes cinctipes TaxID=88211 RepID=A0AAE1EM25_PETCI|nr:hypothetical protein Pcinc_037966 [Petrolisthes cinctipes]
MFTTNIIFIHFLVWVAIHCCDSAWSNGSVVFVILDQEVTPHMETATHLASHLTHQANQLQLNHKIYIASEEWPNVAAWTYIPVLERVSSSHGDNSTWVVLLGERVQVKLTALLDVLQAHNSSQLIFLGRGVSDHQETIIHHYQSVDPDNPFLYPDARFGIVLSTPLVNRLAKMWNDSGGRKQQSEFNIDAAYEFSTLVWSVGVRLTHTSAFCITDRPGCALVYTKLTRCSNKLQTEDIHFAVKSCSHFHEERLPIIQDTWLGDATNHAIYSDVKDSRYGTVSLGVPNTERGHCGKTLAIIRHAAQLSHIQWLAIVDDDTLISVQRLTRLLSCYDPGEYVALGERYGFQATTSHGYDYLTGGAGMVFSKVLVNRLAFPSVCKCPSDDTPDDMFLGICLQRMGLPVIHSPTFHQARPKDYPEALLEGEAPISFHKYWMMNPREAYNLYLHTTPYSPQPGSDDQPVSDSSMAANAQKIHNIDEL